MRIFIIVMFAIVFQSCTESKPIVQKEQVRNGYTTTTYLNGLKNGAYKQFFKGKLFVSGNYIDDKKDGAFKFYDFQTGKVYRIEPYVKGKKEGLLKSYLKTGQLYEEINYKEGKKDGVSKLYFRNGKVQEKIHYKNGRFEGEFTRYMSNGSISFHAVAKQGLIIGPNKRSHSSYDRYLKKAIAVLERKIRAKRNARYAKIREKKFREKAKRKKEMYSRLVSALSKKDYRSIQKIVLEGTQVTKSTKNRDSKSYVVLRKENSTPIGANRKRHIELMMPKGLGFSQMYIDQYHEISWEYSKLMHEKGLIDKSGKYLTDKNPIVYSGISSETLYVGLEKKGKKTVAPIFTHQGASMNDGGFASAGIGTMVFFDADLDGDYDLLVTTSFGGMKIVYLKGGEVKRTLELKKGELLGNGC